MKSVFLLSALILSASIAPATSGQPERPLTVSMIDLLANKLKYDGKFVAVSGYISIRFEDNALYFDENAYLHLFTENAIWIDYDDAAQENFEKANQRYGYIWGLFRANKCGHLCLYAGALESASIGLTHYDTSDKPEN